MSNGQDTYLHEHVTSQYPICEHDCISVEELLSIILVSIFMNDMRFLS